MTILGFVFNRPQISELIFFGGDSLVAFLVLIFRSNKALSPDCPTPFERRTNGRSVPFSWNFVILTLVVSIPTPKQLQRRQKTLRWNLRHLFKGQEPFATLAYGCWQSPKKNPRKDENNNINNQKKEPRRIVGGLVTPFPFKNINSPPLWLKQLLPDQPQRLRPLSALFAVFHCDWIPTYRDQVSQTWKWGLLLCKEVVWLDFIRFVSYLESKRKYWLKVTKPPHVVRLLVCSNLLRKGHICATHLHRWRRWLLMLHAVVAT